MDSRPVVLAVGAQALLVACAAALPAAFGAHLYATSALLVLIAAWIATVYAWRVASKPAAVVPAPEPAQAREAAGGAAPGQPAGPDPCAAPDLRGGRGGACAQSGGAYAVSHR